MAIITIIALVTKRRDSIQCKIGPKRVACILTAKQVQVDLRKARQITNL